MSAQTDTADADFIAEALPTFISEAREQIETITQLLLQLEDVPDDRDLLDAVFRCAHTVKGSAGMFGLDAVVGFTHHVETLLDSLRDGKIALTPGLSTLLLQCNDQIRGLIDVAGDGAADTAQADRDSLIQQLHAADTAREPAPAATMSDQANSAASARHADTTASGQDSVAENSAPPWHVSAGFLADTFRNGMDPLALLHYLAGMGRVARIACDIEAVPTLEAIEPESCYLHFELGFPTAEKVTNLSGRGVGMDVVRRNIEALRGSVTLSSEPGQGSQVEIRLPLTLAIIDGFLVGVGPSKFIFPLDAVVEVIDARSSATTIDAHGRGVVELRGQSRRRSGIQPHAPRIVL